MNWPYALGGHNPAYGVGYDMPEWYLSQIEEKIGLPPDRIMPDRGAVLVYYKVDGGEALIVGGVRDELIRSGKILFLKNP
jgi:hypothetical protein